MNSKIKIFGKCIELPFKITFKRFIILLLLFLMCAPLVFVKHCYCDFNKKILEYEKQNLRG